MATPMIRQYEEIKAKNKNAILLFRLGDFYEMFGDDAIRASEILEITLTARNKGNEKMPMCGVPYHSVENYIAKLTRAGLKVAICDQISDPKLPGIVKREITRTITPGTTFNDSLLNQKTNNYLVCLSRHNDIFGLAYTDITTGDFFVTEVETENELINEITKINPAECISGESEEDETFTMLKDSFEHTSFFVYENFKDSEEAIKDHYNLHSLNGFGLENKKAAIKAAGLLLLYLIETQKNELKHLKAIKFYSTAEFMPLDEATLRNLELVSTLRDQDKEGSLLSVLDETITSMGGRLLKKWLLKPLIKEEEIQKRLDSVEELLGNPELLGNLRETLKDALDIERIISRLSLGTGNARDLIALKNTLNKIPVLQELLGNSTLPGNTELRQMSDLTDLIETSIEHEPPITPREGGMIKDGYNHELDELKKISREGKTYIKNLQEKEIRKTGINSLKVKYNKVFGYYIEVSKTNLSLVPEDYIRKQTLVNAERFITPELKEYEEKVLGAQEKITELEYKLFNEIREKAVEKISEIQHNAQIIAGLDCLCSFAYVAKLNNYCKPQINTDNKIEIKEGRHPVVEKMTFSGDFISNDTNLDNVDNRLLLITGPNMGGKSTILRQVAIIVLMSHIGSFVPADKAIIGLVDRIFTRVGASDNLIKGQSTFMVEMQEAANILNNATEKSLIILDEIGRGTSTYDGVSIAWAITEYIHNNIKAKTLFASHYHELISVVDSLKAAKNLSVGVKEKEDGILFLYKLYEGGIDKSYGIEVAKLAGLPPEVVEKSKTILKDLEEDVVDTKIQQKARKEKINEDQMALFEQPRLPQNLNKIKEELNQLDINGLTPLEALQKLDELKKNSN